MRAAESLADRGNKAFLLQWNNMISAAFESDPSIDWLVIASGGPISDLDARSRDQILLCGPRGHEPGQHTQELLASNYGERLYWVGFQAGAISVAAESQLIAEAA